MFMGEAFVADTQQAAPRGHDKLFSTNWFMTGAEHHLGKGSIMFRLMLSLEPATITDRRYPELFQTGETAYGIPLVDAQHPHNFIMGLSVTYAHPVGRSGLWEIYYAPVGDPALGPVAFPHRASAVELPQAPLGHHWEDSTHIAYNVATTALTYKKLRWEASGFHGAEPARIVGLSPMAQWILGPHEFPYFQTATGWHSFPPGGSHILKPQRTAMLSAPRHRSTTRGPCTTVIGRRVSSGDAITTQTPNKMAMPTHSNQCCH